MSCRSTEELKTKDYVPPDMRKLNQHIKTRTIGFSHPAWEFPQSIYDARRPDSSEALAVITLHSQSSLANGSPLCSLDIAPARHLVSFNVLALVYRGFNCPELYWKWIKMSTSVTPDLRIEPPTSAYTQRMQIHRAWETTSVKDNISCMH